jgi:hypothetical protein
MQNKTPAPNGRFGASGRDTLKMTVETCNLNATLNRTFNINLEVAPDT